MLHSGQTNGLLLKHTDRLTYLTSGCSLTHDIIVYVSGNISKVCSVLRSPHLDKNVDTNTYQGSVVCLCVKLEVYKRVSGRFFFGFASISSKLVFGRLLQMFFRGINGNTEGTNNTQNYSVRTCAWRGWSEIEIAKIQRLKDCSQLFPGH